MLAFLATIILQKLQCDNIKRHKKRHRTSPERSFMKLRHQNYKIYKKGIISQESEKEITEIYKILVINYPITIPR
jgi:hypothetical protein